MSCASLKVGYQSSGFGDLETDTVRLDDSENSKQWEDILRSDEQVGCLLCTLTE